MKPEELQQNLYTKLLTLRAIERIVSTQTFQEAYKLADEVEKKIVLKLIEEYKKDEINLWVTDIIRNKNKDITEYTIRELRTYARRIGIPNYSLLTKYLLLEEITKYIKWKDTINKSVNQTSDKISN